MFWIIVLVIVIVIVIFAVKNSVKKNKRIREYQEHMKDLETRAAAGDEAAKEELQKQLEARAATGDKAAKEELQKQAAEKRKVLEARAAAGDEAAKQELEAAEEAAKQELIERGTDYDAHFSYGNFDFDKDALQRVYDLTIATMTAKGFPWFDMEEMKSMSVGERYSPLSHSRYEWKGKTPRGDTVFITYQIGKNTVGHVYYKLHLKALPEEAEAVGKMVREEMEKFLSTVPKWSPNG
jgi:hypothetical protein